MVFIYFCLFILAVVWKSGTCKKKGYARFVAFIFFMIAFLKSIDFGSDDLSFYYGYYKSLPSLSYQYLIELGRNNMLKDTGFYLVAKFFADAGISAQLWMGIIGLLFGISVAFTIYKYSKHDFISVLMLFSLSYLSFSLTGLRQTVSLSITILAYRYAKEKRAVPFFALVLLASAFHSSALFFLIAFFLPRRKTMTISAFIVIVIQVIIASLMPDYFRRAVALIGWTESLQSYSLSSSALTWSGFIIQLAIYVFCLYLNSDRLHEESEESYDLNLMVIGLAFQTYSSVIAELFRMSMYFSFFGIIAVPAALSRIENDRIRANNSIAVILVLLLYMIYSKAFWGYTFFWNV